MILKKLTLTIVSLSAIIGGAFVLTNTSLEDNKEIDNRNESKKFKSKYKLIKRSTSKVSPTTHLKTKRSPASRLEINEEYTSSASPKNLKKKSKANSKKLATSQKIDSILNEDTSATYLPDDSFTLIRGSEESRSENKEVLNYGIITNSNINTEETKTPPTSTTTPTSSSSKSKPIIIKGRIPALLGAITSYNSNMLIESAYSASCTNPKIELFDSFTMSVVADNPINQEDLKANTEFNFDPNTLGLVLSTPSRYILRTSGCTTNYQRIITSFTEEQDLSPATTLISKIIRTSIELDLETINSNILHEATKELELSTEPDFTEEEVYVKLDQVLNLKTKFQESFDGNDPSLLLDAAPEILEIDIEESLKEKESYTYTVNSNHWNSNYEIAYEWYLNGSLVSNSASWSFTPSANSVLQYNIKLLVGQKNVADTNVNPSLPYHQMEYTIPVQDTFIALAPNFSLNSSYTDPTPTKTITLDLQTGNESSPGIFDNCETFSNLAITEDNTFPSDAEFNISCNTATTQILPYTIQKVNDGDVDINLWAMDINGNRSSAKIITLEVDTTAPALTFNSLATNYRADRTIDIKWDVTEKNNDGVQNFIVDFYDGSSWSNIGNVASSLGPINNQTYTQSFTLPNILVNDARFKVTFQDSLGNTTVLESGDIEINKPVIAVTPSTHNYSDTLNLTNGTVQSFTVSNSGQAPADACVPATLTGSDATEFEITVDNCTTNDLAVSSSCTIDVRPKPTSKGSKSAILNWSCGSDSISSSISYNSTNNAPIAAANKSETLDEDNVLNFTVNSGSDTDGDAITYSVVTAPSNGTLTNCLANDADLTCTYTPSTNYYGTDSFTYKVNDGALDSVSVTTVTLNISSVNDAPVIGSNEAFSTNEDVALNFTFNAASDVDVPTQILSYKIISAPTNGVISNCIDTTNWLNDRECTYTPNSNYNGSDSFTYRAYDTEENSISDATITLTINSVNDAPVLVAGQSETTNEDTQLNFTLAQATDIDLDSLTYSIVSSTTNGTLNCIGAEGRTCTYNPNTNYNGSDSFTYKANDGSDDSNAVTVNIIINPINDAPTLVTTQAVSTNEDTAVNFNLNTGSDIESSPLSYIIVANPSSGTLNCTGGTSTACTYTPAANENGTRTFTYKVNDGELDSTIATVTITVNAINDAPVMLADQSFTTNEDTSYSVTLNGATDQETATGSLTYKITSAPTNGTLSNCIDSSSWNGDIICDYVPNTNFNGSDSFSYKAYDGALESSTSATVNITISAVNDAPTLAATQTVSTNEDNLLNFNLNSGSDIENDTLSYIIISQPIQGTLNCVEGSSRACTYTPDNNDNGTETFTYKVNDGSLDSTTATVTINITAQNDPPVVASSQSFSTNEDSPLNFTIDNATDIDIPSQTISYKVITAPSNGTLTNCISAGSYTTDLTCTYTPSLNFNGTDSFTYRANDGLTDSSSDQTISFTINAVNDAPTLAATQAISTNEDTAINFNLNTGSDIESSPLSYIVVANPSSGTLNCTGGTSTACTYTPAANENGTRTFTYKVNDGELDSTIATVTITINAINDAPVMLADQSFTTNEDTSYSVTLNGATDQETATGSLTYKITSAPTNGTLSNCIDSSSWNGDIICDYVPNNNFNGSDSFSYKAYDGTLESGTNSTVSITVTAVNDAPTLAATQSITTNEDTTHNFNLNTGSDIDLDTLSYIIVSNPASGSLSCTGGTSRDCTYTPATNFNGTTTFTYKVNDGALDSTISTGTITVNAVNDAPTLAATQSVSTNEDTAKVFNLTAGSDTEGDTLSYIVVSSTSNGTLNCDGATSRSCTYTPSLNFNGVDTFTYKVNDGALDSGLNTVTMTVNPINDAPIRAADQSISTNEDTVANFTLNSGSDVDGDTLSYSIVGAASNGIVNCTAQNCSYTPNLNYNGADSFTYKVNDGSLDSVANTTVSITVNSVNDRPVMAADQNFTTDDNVTLSITLSNASDTDGDSLSYKIVSAPSNGTLSSCITTGSYGTDLTCNYNANANFNGNDSFSFIANDGTIDALTVETVNITVNDKTSPASPAIALSSGLYTNSTATTYTASNCSDTPQIYFNEGAQPSSGAAGWQNCTTTNSAHTFTLATTNQGIHEVKVWSKDAYGNVSSSPTTINITYDTVLPTIATTDPIALKGGSSNTVSWNTTELNSSTALNYTVSFYNGSAWSTLGTTASTNGPLASAPFSYSWTAPSLDISNAKFKVDFTDLAGNSRSISSVDFDIDSTPPTVTIASPANGSYHTSSTTVSGTCETGIDVNFSGDIQTSFNIACTGGTYSQLVNFSNGDGNKDIIVKQTDPAGNITSLTRNLIRDEVAPVLTKTGGVSPDFTKNNTPNQWSGTCEGTYIISVTGDETTSFACSSGTWNWTPSAKTVDGSYSYSLLQTDGAGNTSTSLSLSWDRDATPPDFTATSPFTANVGETITETTNHDALTFSGSCEGNNSIDITGDASQTIGCSSTNWTWTTPTYGSDGTRTFVLTQSDPAGNTSDLTITWTRDTTGPALSIANNSFKTNGDSISFSGSCEAGLTIDITGSETTTTSCAAGTWNWASSTHTADATRTFNFAQTNAMSNTTTVIGTWIRETDAPTISALSTTAPDPTKNPNIPMTMTATSQNSSVGISHICIKSVDTSQPIASDDCWVAVNDPSIGLAVTQVLNLSGNYFHLLGWTPNVSTPVYAWVQDEAGNISTLSNGGLGTNNQDKISRVFDPGVPPTIADVIAANTPSTPNPPTRAQSSVPAGSDVYIRYKVNDDAALPSGAISIYYSPNEIDFTLISGAESLDAGTNNGCAGYTLEANEGCFKWTGGSPYNDSYKVRVKVTDSAELSAQSISNPLNSDTIKIIAGNTESGLGGSALSAMFFTRKSGSESDPGTLVVTENGTVYFNDYKRGILIVDPQDGKQKIFIKQTGSSTGDGGAATNATLNYAVKIALDFQNRLLILDRNRVRRVNLNEATPTIETIIGGGSNTADTIANPLDLQIYSHSTNSWSARNTPFFAMPNGDIYFMSDYGIKDWNKPSYRLRIFKSATGQVTSKYVTGTGDAIDHDQNILECRISHFGLAYNPSSSALTGAWVQTYHEDSYGTCNNHNDRWTKAFLDPNTFVARNDFYNDSYRYYRHFPVTGMNGKQYQIIDRNYVMRNNWDGTYTKVLGHGSRGHCADGTAALSCKMDIQDFFVTPTGKFYFTDAGQIRTLDSNGNVVTLFGQHPAYGDNINALNSRFGLVHYVSRLDNGKIITSDTRSYYFKEFEIEGNINIIAGNGNYGTQDFTTDPKAQHLYTGSYFLADKSNGNIMVRRGSNGDMIRLNRSTNLWERIIGSGGTHFWSADGLPGLSITGSTSGNQSHGLPIGFGGGKLLVSRMKYNNTDKHWEDFALKTYDSANSFTQAHLAGTNGANTWTGGSSGMCASGSSAATCKMPHWDYWGSNAWWDAPNNRWILIGRYGIDRQIWSITPGGNAVKLASTPRNVDETAIYLNESGTDVLYYCNNGKFWKYDITNGTDLGVLNWPISNLYCRGYRIDYNPTNNSIIFPFEQNGLYGVAEYFLQ